MLYSTKNDTKELKFKFWEKYFRDDNNNLYPGMRPHNRDYTSRSAGTPGMSFCAHIGLSSAEIDLQLNPKKNAKTQGDLLKAIIFINENKADLLEKLGDGFIIEESGSRLKIRKNLSSKGNLLLNDSWTELIDEMQKSQSHLKNTMQKFFEEHRSEILYQRAPQNNVT